MKKTLLSFALLSLVVCLASAWTYFTGSLSQSGFRILFALASASWFIFATWWAYQR